MPDLALFNYRQPNGLAPAVVARGEAAGESGLSILHAQFSDGAYLRCYEAPHRVFFHLSEPAWVDCRVAGRLRSYRAQVGTMGISPSGADCVAEATGDVESLAIAIDPAALALAASEGAEIPVEVTGCLAAEDERLLHLGHALSQESQANYPNGSLYWHELADSFIDRLLARHTTVRPTDARAKLGAKVLGELRDFIHDHLDERIDVATLARIAGHSPFHFTRILRAAVGVTPHRYVVHLRLKRALELLRQGEQRLADVAAQTGFSDQSHLSRWMRRVYGVSLRQVC